MKRHLTLFAFVAAWGAVAIAEDSVRVPWGSFETAEDMAHLKPLNDGVVLRQSSEHATAGMNSLQLTFQSGASKSSGLRFGVADHGRPADWSSFRALRLDVFNPLHRDWPRGHQRSDTRLDVTIRDAHGNTWWHRFALSPYSSGQVVEVPLVVTLDRISSKGDVFDFRAVASVTLYTRLSDREVVLFFDDLRLTPKGRQLTGKAGGTILPRIPPRTLDRTFTFLQYYAGRDYPYAERGFFRLGKGPVVLRLEQPGYPALGVTLPELLEQAVELRRRGIPFHVILFNFWGGRYETYEEATSRLRDAIARIAAACGDSFQAIWLHELSAVTRYRIVAEQTDRLKKADAYITFLRKFLRDLAIPPGTLLLANQDRMINYGLDFEAGMDAILPETLFNLDNVELCVAEARGSARSSGRWWGGDTARYSAKVSTAAYNRDGSPAPVTIDYAWWKTSDVYKAFVHHYYSGADLLRGQSEWPHRHPEDGPLFDQFLRFVKDHPRAPHVVRQVAVVRGKGDYWGGANLSGQPRGLGEWKNGSDASPEEIDFLYLNAFLPGFSNDGHTAKSFWTGTPLGPIDVVYPTLPLDAMKDYRALVFLGFHRVDSVRADFLADLARYVEAGGTVLLAADQLRMSDERFAPAVQVERLCGVTILDRNRLIKGPLHVVENTHLRFPQGTYSLELGPYETEAQELVPTTATPLVRDIAGGAVVLVNRLGKGIVVLVATPTLSAMPPAGENALVDDLLHLVACQSPYPLSITPASPYVEFLLGNSADGRAVVFLMNHERAEWAGQVIVDRAAAGLVTHGTAHVSVAVGRGYETSTPTVAVSAAGPTLTISGLRLPGASAGFDPYREASFAVIAIQGSRR